MYFINIIKFFRKQVVSGGIDGIVEVWNFKPQIRPFKFTGHKGAINDVLFNADSTKVISCGDDREIKIWKNSVYFIAFYILVMVKISQ